MIWHSWDSVSLLMLNDSRVSEYLLLLCFSGEELWRHLSLYIPNSMQTEICTKEMQLWVPTALLFQNEINRMNKCRYASRLNNLLTHLPTVLSHSSASDRHLQCDRGGAGRWSERCGAERWHLCDQAGEPGVLPVQPAQQAHAHHTHHQPAREYCASGRIPPGCHRQVHLEKSLYEDFVIGYRIC